MAESVLNEIVQVHEAPDDLLAAMDYCYEQGWTDGLPVVPPEASRVEHMLAADGRSPDTVFATHPATGLALSCDFLITAMGD